MSGKQEDSVELEHGGVKKSIRIDSLTLDQLVQLSQGFGHQIDRLRQQRAYLKAKIDERLALMERTGDESRKEGQARMAKHLAELELARQAVERAGGATDGTAPGAVIEVQARND